MASTLPQIPKTETDQVKPARVKSLSTTKWGTACAQCASAKAKCSRQLSDTPGSKCDRYVCRQHLGQLSLFSHLTTGIMATCFRCANCFRSSIARIVQCTASPLSPLQDQEVKTPTEFSMPHITTTTTTSPQPKSREKCK